MSTLLRGCTSARRMMMMIPHPSHPLPSSSCRWMRAYTARSSVREVMSEEMSFEAETDLHRLQDEANALLRHLRGESSATPTTPPLSMTHVSRSHAPSNSGAFTHAEDAGANKRTVANTCTRDEHLSTVDARLQRRRWHAQGHQRLLLSHDHSSNMIHDLVRELDASPRGSRAALSSALPSSWVLLHADVVLMVLEHLLANTSDLCTASAVRVHERRVSDVWDLLHQRSMELTNKHIAHAARLVRECSCLSASAHARAADRLAHLMYVHRRTLRRAQLRACVEAMMYAPGLAEKTSRKVRRRVLCAVMARIISSTDEAPRRHPRRGVDDDDVAKTTYTLVDVARGEEEAATAYALRQLLVCEWAHLHAYKNDDDDDDDGVSVLMQAALQWMMKHSPAWVPMPPWWIALKERSRPTSAVFSDVGKRTTPFINSGDVEMDRQLLHHLIDHHRTKPVEVLCGQRSVHEDAVLRSLPETREDDDDAHTRMRHLAAAVAEVQQLVELRDVLRAAASIIQSPSSPGMELCGLVMVKILRVLPRTFRGDASVEVPRLAEVLALIHRLAPHVEPLELFEESCIVLQHLHTQLSSSSSSSGGMSTMLMKMMRGTTCDAAHHSTVLMQSLRGCLQLCVGAHHLCARSLLQRLIHLRELSVERWPDCCFDLVMHLLQRCPEMNPSHDDHARCAALVEVWSELERRIDDAYQAVKEDGARTSPSCAWAAHVAKHQSAPAMHHITATLATSVWAEMRMLDLLAQMQNCPLRLTSLGCHLVAASEMNGAHLSTTADVVRVDVPWHYFAALSQHANEPPPQKVMSEEEEDHWLMKMCQAELLSAQHDDDVDEVGPARVHRLCGEALSCALMNAVTAWDASSSSSSPPPPHALSVEDAMMALPLLDSATKREDAAIQLATMACILTLLQPPQPTTTTTTTTTSTSSSSSISHHVGRSEAILLYVRLLWLMQQHRLHHGTQPNALEQHLQRIHLFIFSSIGHHSLWCHRVGAVLRLTSSVLTNDVHESVLREALSCCLVHRIPVPPLLLSQLSARERIMFAPREDGC